MAMDGGAKNKKLFQPSPFWERLGRLHSQELEHFGIHNFKRTVNLRYFNWGLFGLFAHQFLPLAANWLKSRNFRVFSAYIANNNDGPRELAFNPLSGRIYAIICAMLFERTRRQDPLHLLESYVEPAYGNPYVVRAIDRDFTQDACNSVHEFYASTRELSNLSDKTVLEIGAGYGRLAHLFLSMNHGLKYWIIDIKPAIDVSQDYLTKTLPQRKIFGYRPFTNFDQVRGEVMDADVCFFTADQTELLPDRSADLVICISNLHEMSRQQIDFYYDQIDRLCRGYFYSKQWVKSIANENGFTIRRDEYPIKPFWHQMFNERHDIQSWFFHSLHKIS